MIDKFILFYLTWIEPEKNTLIKTDCYKHIDNIRKVLDIPDGSRASVWKATSKKGDSHSGAQIDLLFDRDDEAITICEIKYSATPFTLDKAYVQNILNKKEIFIKKVGTAKQIFITLIAFSGVKNNFYADSVLSGIVSLNDLFD